VRHADQLPVLASGQDGGVISYYYYWFLMCFGQGDTDIDSLGPIRQ